MDNHSVAGQISVLASIVNNLSVASTGTDSRTLIDYQNDLTDQGMSAIMAALNAETAQYVNAYDDLSKAITSAKAAEDDIAKVDVAITDVGKAISTVATLLSTFG